MADRRFLRMPDVCATVGLSESRIYELIRENRFPKSVTLDGAKRWVSTEVQAWMSVRIKERDEAMAS